MGDEGTTPPLGQGVWAGTRLVLPDTALAPRWRDLLTDRTVALQTADDRRVLDMAEVFQELPVALLVEEPEGAEESRSK